MSFNTEITETNEMVVDASETAAVPAEPMDLPIHEASKRKRKKRTNLKSKATKTAVQDTASAKPEFQRKENVSDEVVIRFDNVTKVYHLYDNDRWRFLGLFKNKEKDKHATHIEANKNLSFEIKRGEAVAFLGRNGAGKSTALKMITGVTQPTSGTVEVAGPVSALLELSAGFDSRLTGRENIRLRGQILGMTDKEIDRVMPKVIEFADLGVFLDQPMRTYSSGMRARLGFAFAVQTDPEILIVDEALSVGDRAFRTKCIKRIKEIMQDDNLTVLFVTHSSSMAKKFCSRGIVLNKGVKVFEGGLDDAMEYYTEHFT